MILSMNLPLQVTAFDVASACRVALQRFAMLQPTHVALFEWLSTSYRDALVGPRDQWPPLLRYCEPVADVVVHTQRMLADLERRARDPSATFVGELPQRVGIARVCDAQGEVAYAPIDARGATLVDRVTTLFLADYLTCPNDYLPSAVRTRWVTMGDA